MGGGNLAEEKGIALQPFLDTAMARRYSASPYEDFFTGGGVHHFENFDKQGKRALLELRDAFRNSNNLVFIRLMRDLVSYHRARLAYDADDVLANPANPDAPKDARGNRRGRIPRTRCAAPIRTTPSRRPKKSCKRLLGARATPSGA